MTSDGKSGVKLSKGAISGPHRLIFALVAGVAELFLGPAAVMKYQAKERQVQRQKTLASKKKISLS